MCQGETQNRCGSTVGCSSTADQCGAARESTINIHRSVRRDVGITADVIALTQAAVAKLGEGVGEEAAYADLRAYMKALDKRLDAAEEHAKLDLQMQRAACQLPDGYILHVSVEKGAGWVVLDDVDGADSEPARDYEDSSLARQVEVTIDAAIAHAAALPTTA